MLLRDLDWLEEQLEKKDLSPEKRQEYERQVEQHNLCFGRLAAIELEKLAAEALEEERRKDIMARLLANDASVVKMYGEEEFGEDYDLFLDGDEWVVLSRVARPDQEHRHRFSIHEEAISKRWKLIWDRLYTKYVRSGEIDQLISLEVRIVR